MSKKEIRIESKEITIIPVHGGLIIMPEIEISPRQEENKVVVTITQKYYKVKT